MRGRIWGASNALHVVDLNPYTVAVESFARVTITNYEHRVVKVSKPIYAPGLFNEQVFLRMETVDQVNSVATTRSDFDPPIIDQHAARWLEWLEDEHVPKADIDRATACAGEHFVHYGGKVIPLEYPQKDLLRSFSPLLFERYAAHYCEMFNSLYPTDTHE